MSIRMIGGDRGHHDGGAEHVDPRVADRGNQAEDQRRDHRDRGGESQNDRVDPDLVETRDRRRRQSQQQRQRGRRNSDAECSAERTTAPAPRRAACESGCGVCRRARDAPRSPAVGLPRGSSRGSRRFHTRRAAPCPRCRAGSTAAGADRRRCLPSSGARSGDSCLLEKRAIVLALDVLSSARLTSGSRFATA